MKRWMTALCALAAVFLMTGCGQRSFDPAVSSIYIHKDGTITEAIVETFMEDHYSFPEFQSMVEEEIATYNESSGSEKIVIRSVELKDDTIYVLLDYADAGAYADYNEVYCFQGTVAEALETGLGFDMVFRDRSYEEQEAETATANTSRKVLVLREETVVETEESIRYVSNNVEILDAHRAQVMPIKDEKEYAYIIY